MRRSAGFSLVEMLIAVVIVLTVLAITGPPLSRTYQRERVRRIADEFVTTYEHAREKALRYGTLVELHIDAAGDRYWIEADTTATGQTPLQLTFRETKGVNLVSDRNLLCFDHRGVPTGQGSCDAPTATVTFANSFRTDTVRTTPLGSVLR